MSRSTNKNTLPLPADVGDQRLLARACVQVLERTRRGASADAEVYFDFLTDVVAACDDPAAQGVRLPEWPLDKDKHPRCLGAVLDTLEASAVRQSTMLDDGPGMLALRALRDRLQEATQYREKKAPRQFGQSPMAAMA